MVGLSEGNVPLISVSKSPHAHGKSHAYFNPFLTGVLLVVSTYYTFEYKFRTTQDFTKYLKKFAGIETNY